MAKYSHKDQEKIETVMHEFQLGKIKSGKGFFNVSDIKLLPY
jgi:hypothetical protein